MRRSFTLVQVDPSLEVVPTDLDMAEEQVLTGPISLGTRRQLAGWDPRSADKSWVAVLGSAVRLLTKMVDLINPNAGNVLRQETALISSIKTLSDNLNVSVLYQKYVVERLSAKQIAHQFASSKSGILAALKRAGIQMRASHKTHGRPANPVYGKRLVKGRSIDCPSEQRVIRLIKKMVQQEDLSVRAIARKLTEMGIKTRRGHTRWHHEMVRSILKRNAGGDCEAVHSDPRSIVRQSKIKKGERE